MLSKCVLYRGEGKKDFKATIKKVQSFLLLGNTALT